MVVDVVVVGVAVVVVARVVGERAAIATSPGVATFAAVLSTFLGGAPTDGKATETRRAERLGGGCV